ncbi:hypothetical protein D9M68_187740 [compost metagenome]
MSEYIQDNKAGSPAQQPAFDIDVFSTRLRKHWALLTIATIVGGIGGIGIASVVPKQWEAKALIQVGQVYAISPDGVPATTNLESPARTAEWLQSAAQENKVLGVLGLPTGAGVDKETDLLRTSTKIRYLRAAELIELSTRAYSPERAKQVLATYQTNLLAAHEKLLTPALHRLKADLADVDAGIERRLREAASLEANSTEGTKLSATERFSANALLNQVRERNDTQLRALYQRRVALQEQLNPDRTFNTFAVSPATVGSGPVFPKRSVFALLGAVAGAMFGAAAVALRGRHKSR